MSAPASSHDIPVDAIFRCSWGYDQTNVDFYQVVGVTPKSVKIRQIRSRLVDGDGWAGHVVPCPGEWISDCQAATKRVTTFDCGNGPTASIRIASYADAYLWSGEPAYMSNDR